MQIHKLSSEQKNRLRWSCRRGALELDLVLLPFFEQLFDDLSSEEQNSFIKLLTCEDPLLMSWLMGSAEPLSEFKPIIHLIKHHATHSSKI